MPKYMGNVGHLMQHWTLCELLRIAGKHATELNFIDAHAMAPWATNRNDERTNEFDRVQSRLAALTNHESSTYERAWHSLTQENQGRGEGYPNSAAFVKEVWKGNLSMLLCETDEETIREIDNWLPGIQRLDRCKRVRRFPSDWLKRFAAGLASPSADGLSDEALTLVSFDPDRYDRHRERHRENLRRLYPQDIGLALDALRGLKGGVLVHLCTYSRGGANPQGAVISSVNSIMAAKGFTLSAVVTVDDRMMSLVYGRNVLWWTELADLPDRFTKWLP